MNVLGSFVLKEIRHIVRDIRSLIIIIMMPISQVILFGFAISDEVKNISMGVYVAQPGQLTDIFIEKMKASGYFHEVRRMERIGDAEKEFAKGAMMVISFPLDYEKNFYSGRGTAVQLILDASDMNTSQTILGYVQNILNSVGSDQSPDNNTQVVDVEYRMLYNPSLRSVYMFVPGVLALVMMLVSAMMTAVSIAKEKELSTMRLLFVSPLRPRTIILGKIIPYLIISVINSLSIILLSSWIFSMPLHGNPILLACVCMLFIMTALSLGIMIGALAPSQQLALIISIMAIFLPTLMLSGFVFPKDNMPLPLQMLANISPAKWFITALRSILIRGAGIEVIWKEILVLILMTAIFFRISIKRFRKGMI